jgi:small GTP-binding protein
MSNVFISYVRENSSEIDRLYNELTSRGVNVWLDKHNIYPGERWKDAIRKAIEDGSYFIACFSLAYFQKQKTYMNEELYLAIEELRLRPNDRTWFIPLCIDECDIPKRPIGAGETLSDIQFIDLYKNWHLGIDMLVKVINPNEDYFTKLFQNAKDNINLQLKNNKNLSLNRVKKNKRKIFTVGLIGQTGIGKSTLARALGATESFSRVSWTPVTGLDIREYQWITGCQIVDIPFSYGFPLEKNHELIEYVKNNVDLILNIVHVSSQFHIYHDDYALLQKIREQYNIPILVVLNKIDIIEEKHIKESLEQLVDFLKEPLLPISAHKGTNVNKLKELLLDTLKEMQISPINE